MEQQTSRELLRELEAARQRRDQEQHKLERLENRAAYLRNKERAKRTHQLCIIGGVVEHFIPATKEMDQPAVYLLFEQLSELPEVQTFLAAYKGGDPPSHSTTSM